MDEGIAAFLEKMKGKRIALIGCGKSNLPLTQLFLRYGANVTVCDEKDESALTLASELRKAGIEVRCGKNYLFELAADIVFRSPGIYYNKPELKAFRERGVTVTSEIEVFFKLCPCKTYGITGTDGKTTTTTIVSEILKKTGKTVHVGGNIGMSMLPMIEHIAADDLAVVELSSFQLMSMRRSPDVAAITNIYPDHLNVHKDMAEYMEAKKNILSHQDAFSRAVLNMDNPAVNALSDVVRGDLYKFSIQSRPDRGAYLDSDGWLCFADGGAAERIVHKNSIVIPGMHNVENYLAAICVVHGDAKGAYIAETAAAFGGVEHRMEFVRAFRGVRYYNDSIATGPASVRAGLNAFNQRLIVIAGGSDKQLDYSELSEDLNTCVKVLILLGETADKIEAAVKRAARYDPQNVRIIRVKTMADAVNAAYENAKSGDVVSLSPASASFDMFRDFEERGKVYKALINALS